MATSSSLPTPPSKPLAFSVIDHASKFPPSPLPSSSSSSSSSPSLPPLHLYFIADVPHLIPSIALHLFNEWPDIYRSFQIFSPSQLEKQLRTKYAQKNSVPMTLVGVIKKTKKRNKEEKGEGEGEGEGEGRKEGGEGEGGEEETEDEFVCTASLDVDDVPEPHPYSKCTPWLVCVFTNPLYRGKGFILPLLSSLFSISRHSLSLPYLWLFCIPGMIDFYEKKFFFKRVEESELLGEKIMIMRLDLASRKKLKYEPEEEEEEGQKKKEEKEEKEEKGEGKGEEMEGKAGAK